MPSPKKKSYKLRFFLLLLNIGRYTYERIPLVTLFYITLNIFAFINLQSSIYLERVCIGVNQFWNSNEYWKLITFQIHHIHDFHLYYNILSFLWKGVNIEKKLKSCYFAYLLAVFTVLTSLVTLSLDALYFKAFGSSYNQHCAVGFSGVIFALKVLAADTKLYDTANVTFCEMSINYVCWLELIVIQILVPQVSLTSNLAGILVGLAYTKGLLKILTVEFQPTGNQGTESKFRCSGTAYNDKKWYYNGKEYVEGKSEVLAYELVRDDVMGRNLDFYY